MLPECEKFPSFSWSFVPCHGGRRGCFFLHWSMDCLSLGVCMQFSQPPPLCQEERTWAQRLPKAPKRGHLIVPKRAAKPPWVSKSGTLSTPSPCTHAHIPHTLSATRPEWTWEAASKKVTPTEPSCPYPRFMGLMMMDSLG